MNRSDAISSRDFRRLRDLIESEFGMELVPAKRVMLEARLQKRVRLLGLDSFAAYCEYIHTPARPQRGVAEPDRCDYHSQN